MAYLQEKNDFFLNQYFCDIINMTFLSGGVFNMITIDNKVSINDTIKSCIPGETIYLKNGIYRIDNFVDRE